MKLLLVAGIVLLGSCWLASAGLGIEPQWVYRENPSEFDFDLRYSGKEIPPPPKGWGGWGPGWGWSWGWIGVGWTTESPVTDAPVTDAPVTDAPVTDAPVTDAPVTDAPVTDAPVTDAPVTDAPVTDAPVTDAPVTDAPVTDAPVTDAPVTDAPVTDSPVTDAPVTVPPIDCNPGDPAACFGLTSLLKSVLNSVTSLIIAIIGTLRSSALKDEKDLIDDVIKFILCLISKLQVFLTIIYTKNSLEFFEENLIA